jgi:hypothetical protein
MPVKHFVGGSNPSGAYGNLCKWLKRGVCKTSGVPFGGSNPSIPKPGLPSVETDALSS